MNNIKFYAVVQQFDPDSQNSFYKVEALKLIDIESSQLPPLTITSFTKKWWLVTIR